GFFMSRTQIILKCNDRNTASELIDGILDSKRYDHIQKNGEDYWKQGLGVTESPKFIRYYFDEENIILEGWVSNFGKESNLDGVIGALPKNSCKKVLNEIKDRIEELNSQPISADGLQQFNSNNGNVNVDNSINHSNHDSTQVIGRTFIKSQPTAHKSAENNMNSLLNNSNMQSNASIDNSNNLSSNNGNQNKSASNGFIPKRYRGSILTNIFEILIALFYIYGASTGYLVLRFTDSSEALILVAIIILIHGIVSLILNLSEK
ncbi:MAG: hypothetical protein BZ137_00030, partial [Methanosphaera sp. rholeuAM130]